MEAKGMVARYFLVIAVGVLFVFPASAKGPTAAASGPITNTLLDTVTVVSSDTVNAGTFAVERVTCPAGMTATGGGVKSVAASTLNWRYR